MTAEERKRKDAIEGSEGKKDFKHKSAKAGDNNKDEKESEKLDLEQSSQDVSVPEEELIERVVKISRVSKVVKGGKNFSFNALVINGDANGKVGIGLGKSNEVIDAIRKGSVKAKRSYFKVNMHGDTIPHEVTGKFKAATVVLKPAGPGTGVIAGGPVRAMCDAVGIKNILTKSLGSRNPINVVKATVDGFRKLRLKRRG